MRGERSCAVPSCKLKQSQNPNISLFNFPSDLDEQNIWKKLCNIPDKNTRNHVICSIHFEPHLYGKKHLEKNARPTLFLSQTGLDKKKSTSIPEKSNLPEETFSNFIIKNTDKAIPNLTQNTNSQKLNESVCGIQVTIPGKEKRFTDTFVKVFIF